MAKIDGPLFSMAASGKFGNIVFDKRGIARLKVDPEDARTPAQGNQRQTMSAAQRCVQLCGPDTRERLKQAISPRSRWHTHLIQRFIGDNRSQYQTHLATYQNGIDRAAWETAAAEAGLEPVQIDYAEEAPVSPGTQLFMLASTLYDFEIYQAMGDPADGETGPDVAGWKESILS